MLDLPDPASGGKIDDLRSFINLPNDDAWSMYVAWLSSCFRPHGPYANMVVNGEQGSAKTTACKLSRMLVDPNKAMLRRPPRTDRDLIISATNAWLVAFDNMSSIPPWLSDAICMLSSGCGFATRQLFTDDDEQLFEAARPVLINGIEDSLCNRPDLVDRCIQLTLPRISDSDRREEEDLFRAFGKAHPQILGGLLDVVVGAIAKVAEVHLDAKPRMADFARWSVAGELAMEWPPRFLSAYMESRDMAKSLALEASLVGPVIVAFMTTHTDWEGTARELLDELTHGAGEQTKSKKWPDGAGKLRGELRRLAPVLRASGVQVEFTVQRVKGGYVLRLSRLDPDSTTPTTPVTPNRSCETGTGNSACASQHQEGYERGQTSVVGTSDSEESGVEGVVGAVDPTPTPNEYEADPDPLDPDAWQHRFEDYGGEDSEDIS